VLHPTRISTVSETESPQQTYGPTCTNFLLIHRRSRCRLAITLGTWCADHVAKKGVRGVPPSVGTRRLRAKTARSIAVHRCRVLCGGWRAPTLDCTPRMGPNYCVLGRSGRDLRAGRQPPSKSFRHRAPRYRRCAVPVWICRIDHLRQDCGIAQSRYAYYAIGSGPSSPGYCAIVVRGPTSWRTHLRCLWSHDQAHRLSRR
jgi:hypothetical protein